LGVGDWGLEVKRTAGRQPIDRNEYPDLPRHSLIVCATLVQNAANLGGLCRTCEAFRLEALVMANLAITQTPAFRNLAASTDRWQPIVACSVEALSDWLREKQRSGYSLVALHVDASAVALTEFCFPPRSVLVLGQELTGIPPLVLDLCDYVVTIAQWGLVESLNVQTAGAIAIYAYTQQHPIKTKPRK
jgi:tRNA G18 (ribose-2'-O)-methylase SpoU